MASGDLAVIWASARGEHSFPNVIGSYVTFISPCLLWFCLKNNMCPVCILNAFFVQEKEFLAKFFSFSFTGLAYQCLYESGAAGASGSASSLYLLSSSIPSPV